jgi:transposase
MRQSLIYGLEPRRHRAAYVLPNLIVLINFNQSSRYKEGSLTAVAAGEEVVPASELTAALKQVRELQRLLGKKTMEVEILKEAVEYGQSRKWIAHAPLLPKDGE